MELNLTNVPDYCNAQIYPQTVYPRLQRHQTKPEIAILTVSVDPATPGFQPFNISVLATASTVKGPLGLLNLIKPSDDSTSISLTTGYYSNFILNYLPFYEILPLQHLEVPMNLTSFANADAFVQTDILEPPVNWSINITSDIIIKPGDTELFLLSITPPNVQNEVRTTLIRFNISAWEHPEYGYDVLIAPITIRVFHGLLFC